MKVHRADINFIQVYAPKADSLAIDIDGFYTNLDEAMKQCKPCEVNITQGDLNAKVGTGQEGQAV